MSEKDAYWFKHDGNARNDLNMIKLRRRGGLEAIGLFWCVIEMLRESEAHELPINDIDDICYELRCENKIFDYLFNCNLLVKNDNVFYSESLKNRMFKLDEIKEKRRIAGSKGGKAKARPKQTKANAKQMLSDKIRKEEIRKEENIVKKKNKQLLTSEEVEEIYSFYPRKEGKANGIKKLLKLKEGETTKEIIIEKVKQYAKAVSDRDKKFIAIFSTWCNGESWNDEYETQPEQTKKPEIKYNLPDFL